MFSFILRPYSWPDAKNSYPKYSRLALPNTWPKETEGSGNENGKYLEFTPMHLSTNIQGEHLSTPPYLPGIDSNRSFSLIYLANEDFLGPSNATDSLSNKCSSMVCYVKQSTNSTNKRNVTNFSSEVLFPYPPPPPVQKKRKQRDCRNELKSWQLQSRL